jgi:CubicO group peptidase (beta-lactamase class C family)
MLLFKRARTDLSAYLLVCLAAVLPPLTAYAQASDTSARLDEAVTAFQKYRGFMGSVLVAKGGTILLDKGYGFADLEWDVANTPDTKFRLGSITKQFTATAILQLSSQGKLSVDDLACKYFDRCPESWKKITIHQLLSHTSGIPSYTALKDFPTPKFLRVPLTPSEILLLTADKPLEFEPGSKWTYSNSGYIFLGLIVEKVSGEKYADYLQKHIFTPLGMNDTGYDSTDEVLKHRASGYKGCGKKLCNSDYIDMSLPYSAGSLYSTAEDLYKWDRALYTDKVLSAALRKKMFTPVLHDYAYGWGTNKIANHNAVSHGGGIPGFATEIQRFIDDDAAVIVLSNTEGGNPGAVASVLASILFGGKVELPQERKFVQIDPQLLDRYTGVFQVGPLKITFTNQDGHLMVAPAGQPTAEAQPLSETKFLVAQVDALFTFSSLDTNGKAQEVTLDQGGAHLAGKRIAQQ